MLWGLLLYRQVRYSLRDPRVVPCHRFALSAAGSVRNDQTTKGLTRLTPLLLAYYSLMTEATLCGEPMARCRRPSRWCLRVGHQCRLPSAVDGSKFHTAVHHAYACAELVRPFPLGTVSRCPPPMPDMHSIDLPATWQRLEESLYTHRRLGAPTEDDVDDLCTGSFLELSLIHI